VASIAFGEPVAAVDVNVRRIIARVCFGREPDEVASADLDAEAQRLVPAKDPGGWNQALMDLGRTACRPRPRCDACVLRPWCAFAASGAIGRGTGRRQGTFEGSVRQARGAIVAELRSQASIPTRGLPARLGIERERVDAAMEGLTRDGLVVAAGGRIRLVS
jgi:A/G-specific adenine glycosylase